MQNYPVRQRVNELSIKVFCSWSFTKSRSSHFDKIMVHYKIAEISRNFAELRSIRPVFFIS